MKEEKYAVKTYGLALGYSHRTGAKDIKRGLINCRGFDEDDFVMDWGVVNGRRLCTWFFTDSGYEKLQTRLNDMKKQINMGIAQPEQVQPPAPIEKNDDELLKKALGTIEDLKNQLAKCEKEVMFARAVKVSDDCVNVGVVARLIAQNGVEMSEPKMFKWLRENGYIEDVDRFHNIPTEKAINSGYMKFTEVTVCSGSSGAVHLNFTPKITGKGQEYFINGFCNAKPVQ